jgi:plasmid stability protein
MANLQIKNMNDQLYKALAKRAELDNRSISQEVVNIIKQYLAGTTSLEGQSKGLMELAGAWKGRESAEDMVKELRKVRKSRKRHKNVFD